MIYFRETSNVWLCKSMCYTPCRKFRTSLTGSSTTVVYDLFYQKKFPKTTIIIQFADSQYFLNFRQSVECPCVSYFCVSLHRSKLMCVCVCVCCPEIKTKSRRFVNHVHHCYGGYCFYTHCLCFQFQYFCVTNHFLPPEKLSLWRPSQTGKRRRIIQECFSLFCTIAL